MPPADAIHNEPLRSSGYGNRGIGYGGYSSHLNSFDGNAPNGGMVSFHGTRIASLEMIGADMLGKHEQQPQASRHSLYQFGVFTGGGMRTWLVGMDQWLRDTNITYKFHPESPLARNGLCSLPGLAGAKFWGLDSFQGMPDSPLHMIPPGILRDAGQRDDWSTGGFNAADILREHSWRPFQARLKQNVLREDACIRSPDLHLIRGFYNESLAEGATLARRLKMEPAWLIDIDCDLYSSTVEVLTPTLIPTPDPNLNPNPLPLTLTLILTLT